VSPRRSSQRRLSAGTHGAPMRCTSLIDHAPDWVPDETPVVQMPSRVSRTTGILVVHAAALALVVGVDGPAPWLLVRALVVGGIAGTTAWAWQRSSSRATRWAVLLVGLLGVIVGVGIGVPHAVRAGMSVEAASGVVALGTGLTLAGIGTVSLLRRSRWWTRVAAVPASIAMLTFVVAPVTLAVFVTNVPPLELGSQRPADVGLAAEDVRFHASDGVELAAWYVPSTNGAAVVLLGGATNNRSDELDHAAVLARHGYGVLLLDARGHGDSDGDAMLWGWFGETDVPAAVDFLSQRPDVVDGRIGAIGMSMGAEEAIGAAGEDERIRAVVAEGATARGARDEGDASTGVGSFLPRYVDWVTSRAADVMTSAPRPAKLRDAIAAASPRPVMVIAAGTQPAEIDAAEVFEAASPRTVEVWVADGAGHTTAYDVQPAAWEARVVAFLDRSLG
jgi:dienelactone hydrolase